VASDMHSSGLRSFWSGCTLTEGARYINARWGEVHVMVIGKRVHLSCEDSLSEPEREFAMKNG
jgi:hypothetical protein